MWPIIALTYLPATGRVTWLCYDDENRKNFQWKLFRMYWPACWRLEESLGFPRQNGDGPTAVLSPCSRWHLALCCLYLGEGGVGLHTSSSRCSSWSWWNVSWLQEGLETRVTVKKKVVNATATETKVSKIWRLKIYPKNQQNMQKERAKKAS